MKIRKAHSLFLIIVVILIAYIFMTRGGSSFVVRASSVNPNAYVWNKEIADDINSRPINLIIDGNQITFRAGKKAYMSDDRVLMLPKAGAIDAFDCAINLYNNERLVIEKGEAEIVARIGESVMSVNGMSRLINQPALVDDDFIYIPIDVFTKGLMYSYSWDADTNTASLVSGLTASGLPYYYNYADKGRIGAPKNQGSFGTCWAFAALNAFESTLLPEESYNFSEEHMVLGSAFNMDLYSGGDYIKSIAYFAGWQGPVMESDDGYGDYYTPRSAKVVKHLQEAQIIPANDRQGIKSMVYKYGAVQSSIYTSMTQHTGDSSGYYNREKAAYCYRGDNKANHDIVIIGWDDTFPKSYFTTDIEEDGAFICMNSWGAGFGDKGIFYVSYYDSNIGLHNVVYTGIESADNYDNIYQYDPCGWVGQIGYGEQSAFCANVYEAEADENLKAVGFYATAAATTYQVYVCKNYQDESSLSVYDAPLAEGYFANPGFYTVTLPNEVRLNKGEKFAVIVNISTEGAERPIAVEYSNDEATSGVTLEGKESYISLRGYSWDSTQDKQSCNVCLKAYTNIRTGE